MSLPFAFVPRVVSKHAKPWQGISRFSTLSPSPGHTTDSSDDDDDDGSDIELSSKSVKRKDKEKGIEGARQSNLAQDIASLISLALSDYNIWLDPDLRSKLDACLNDETLPDAAGFVPINYLLRRAPFRASLPLMQKSAAQQPEPSETDVVKALRTYASHVLEVRMRLPSTSSPVWYGTGKTSRKKDVGAYEVRRKDWPSLHACPSREWTRAQWDNTTIYMEGIPPSYRTPGGVARFTEILLPPEETGSDGASCLCIQHVSLPPHYLDEPDDIPKCKGYALVTLSTPARAQAFLRVWPWTRGHQSISQDKDVSEAVKDAFKYGLRTISKSRWNTLNEEYLKYKQSLVDEINVYSTELHSGHYQEQEQQGERGDGLRTRRRTTTASPYPFDCLMFVRNVHPETNKTTLKALFGRALQGDASQPQAQLDGAGLDYVDFNKGMDTCYLRIASPQHTTRLIAYFGAQSIAQADGLDSMGRTPIKNEKPISLEMVQGTKEALYWEQVPEKVRRQAVDKVIKTGAESTSMSPTAHPSDTQGSGQRKRARGS